MLESPPVTSRRETSVTTAMCAATTAAAGSARGAPCAPAPMTTSIPRQKLIPGVPAGPDFSARSYPHTPSASGVTTPSARGPSAATASSPAPTVNPAARPSANPGETRPEGIGRPGRSTASTSRSA